MPDDPPFIAESGPSAVGAYPHLRRVGDLIFVSGMGPRTPDTNEIPGGPTGTPTATRWNTTYAPRPTP